MIIILRLPLTLQTSMRLAIRTPTVGVYNGGESLAGVGDAVYLYTAGGKTLKEVTGSTFAWWNVWTVAYDFEAGVYKITGYQGACRRFG